jgi:hypothetical protein
MDMDNQQDQQDQQQWQDPQLGPYPQYQQDPQYQQYLQYQQYTTAQSDAAVDAFLKKSRTGRLVNKIVWGCIAAPFALLWLIIVIMSIFDGIEAVIGSAIMLGIPLLIIFAIAKVIDSLLAKKAQRDAAVLVPEVARELFGPSATFERKEGIPAAHLRQSGFFPHGGRFKTTDLVTGVRNGIPTAFSDAEVSHTEGHGEDAYTTNDFGGLWIMCRMSSPVNGSLRLIEGAGGGHRATGDAWFDTTFGVEESASGIAAAILTPGFVESIRRIERFAGGVLLVWVAGWDLHMAVDFHPDLFEGKSGTKKETANKTAATYRAEFRIEMERVALLVDEIIRNEHLFGPPPTM